MQPCWSIDHHLLLLSDMHAHIERIIDNAKVEQAKLGLDDVQRALFPESAQAAVQHTLA